MIGEKKSEGYMTKQITKEETNGKLFKLIVLQSQSDWNNMFACQINILLKDKNHYLSSWIIRIFFVGNLAIFIVIKIVYTYLVNFRNFCKEIIR